jgi:hypothetical protein
MDMGAVDSSKVKKKRERMLYAGCRVQLSMITILLRSA